MIVLQRRRGRGPGGQPGVLASFVWVLGSLLLLAGCASSRPGGPRPPVPSDDPLPGSGRALPSEENATRPDAGPAFPAYPADLSSTASAPGNGGSAKGVGGSGGGAVAPRPTSMDAGRPEATSRSGPASPNASPPPPTERVTTVPTTGTPGDGSARAPDSPVRAGASEKLYTVQLQVASTAERARDWQDRASAVFRLPVRVDAEAGLYKLRVGLFQSADAAEEVRRDAVAAGYVDALVLSVGGPTEEGAGR